MRGRYLIISLLQHGDKLEPHLMVLLADGPIGSTAYKLNGLLASLKGPSAGAHPREPIHGHSFLVVPSVGVALWLGCGGPLGHRRPKDEA